MSHSLADYKVMRQQKIVHQQFKQLRYSMEGEISKHTSTDSAISSGSHLVFPSDDLYYLHQQMSQCLTTSHELLEAHKQHQARMSAYREQAHRLTQALPILDSQEQEQRMRLGFQKCSWNGQKESEGSFQKRHYCPIILKQAN